MSDSEDSSYYPPVMMHLDRSHKPEILNQRLNLSLDDLIESNRYGGDEIQLNYFKADEIEVDDELEQEQEEEDNLQNLMDHNDELKQSMKQLNNKLNLLQIQKDVNNLQIYKICPHEWIRDSFDAGGRSYRVCKHCHLPQNISGHEIF